MKRALLACALMIPAPLAAASKFVPPPGKVLLIVGQDVPNIGAYLKAAKSVPGGFAAYTSAEGEGLTEMANNGGGIQNAWELADTYPNTVLQLAFYMVDACQKVAAGDVDDTIDALARFLKAANRPVYLRIGYEFDLPENGYKPAEYIPAYRHVVDRLRAQGVTNVAYVWHSCAASDPKPYEVWYPGDDYVDWFAISYFDQPKAAAADFAELAKKHGKPLMIAESAPWHLPLDKSDAAWDRWFLPLFDFIRAHDVRALSYINCDWDKLPLFESQGWGDTRLQSNPAVLKKWLAETAQDRYLKSSDRLFPQLGFKKQPTEP
jgi:hypothetical protein